MKSLIKFHLVLWSIASTLEFFTNPLSDASKYLLSACHLCDRYLPICKTFSKMWSPQLLQHWYTKTIVWHSIVSHANTSPWGNNWIKPLLYIVSHTFMAPCNIQLPLEHRNEHHPTPRELDLNRVIVVNVSIISIDKNNTHRNHSLASCAKT